MLKKYKHFVFIAAGGKGKRLWSTYPILKSYDLPKSLGLIFDGKPLIAHQLESLTKLPDHRIIVCFDESRSLEYFTALTRDGVVPRHPYIHLLDHYGPKNNMIDVVLGSGVKEYLGNDFETVIISAGDIFYDDKLILKMFEIYCKHGCNVQSGGAHFPLLLTKKAFGIYTQVSRKTALSDFARRARFEGEEFKTVGSKIYFDVDTPDDYCDIEKYLKKTS